MSSFNLFLSNYRITFIPVFQIVFVLGLSIFGQSQKIPFFIVSSTPPPSSNLTNIVYLSLSDAIMYASSWQEVNLTNPFTIYVGNGGTIKNNRTKYPGPASSSQNFNLTITAFSCNLVKDELKNYMNYCTKERPVVDFPERYTGNYHFYGSAFKHTKGNEYEN